MSKYAMTAKDAGVYAKRTANPVVINGAPVTVYLNKGENGKGWDAFVSDFPGDVVPVHGKTQDDAVDAMITHLTVVAGTGIGETDDTADTADTADTDTAEPVAEIIEPETETETETETEATDTADTAEPAKGDKERAALIAHAVKRAREAAQSFRRGEMPSGTANGIVIKALQEVTDLVSSLTGGERKERMANYAVRLGEHYYGITGGGDTVLSDAQRSRAGKKFRKVCAEYAA
jgi:hypothetical protein